MNTQDIFQKIEARDAAMAPRKSKSKSKSKSKTVRLYCVLDGKGPRRVSRFHPRKVAERAVRLAKSWGLDAYRSSPTLRTV